MNSNNKISLLSMSISHERSYDSFPSITIPTTVKESKLRMMWNCRNEILVATLAGIVYTPLAIVIAYSSPALPLLHKQANYHVSPDTGTWFSSLGSLGAAVGTLIGGPQANYLGRKWSLLFSLLFLLLSWVTMIWSTHKLWILITGRIVTSITAGTLLVIIPIYIAEVVSAQLRETLQCYTSLIFQFGYVFIYMIGAFGTFQWLTVACLLHVTLVIACVPYLPESPRWLLSQSRSEEAQINLMWLRQNQNVYKEFDEMKNNLKTPISNKKFKMLLSPKVFKPLLLSMGLMFILTSTGIDVVLFYTVIIFQKAAKGSSEGGNAFVNTVVVSIAGIVGVAAASYFVGKFGQRRMLIISGAFVFISMGVLGGYFKFQNENLSKTYHWIPIVCLVCYIVTYNLGWGCVPYALSAEMLPTEVRAVCGSISFTFMWIMGFLWTKSFHNIQVWIGIHGLFWAFSAAGLLGIPFVYFLIPETKGKTLEEIQQLF